MCVGVKPPFSIMFFIHHEPNIFTQTTKNTMGIYIYTYNHIFIYIYIFIIHGYCLTSEKQSFPLPGANKPRGLGEGLHPSRRVETVGGQRETSGV